mgnify:CR=1 FL=1
MRNQTVTQTGIHKVVLLQTVIKMIVQIAAAVLNHAKDTANNRLLVKSMRIICFLVQKNEAKKDGQDGRFFLHADIKITKSVGE